MLEIVNKFLWWIIGEFELKKLRKDGIKEENEKKKEELNFKEG